MTDERSHKLWVVTITLLLGLILAVLPLPVDLQAFRPDWVALILIYWCMALPTRVGLGTAWVTGLLADVLHGALLGQYALQLTLIAFVTLNIYRRVRVFPLWQQAVVVLVLLMLTRVINFWIQGVAGETPDAESYWWQPIISMLLWPWVFILLRDIRRRHKVK